MKIIAIILLGILCVLFANNRLELSELNKTLKEINDREKYKNRKSDL